MSAPHIIPQAAGRRWLRPAAIGAVILVPLAFAGLFVGAIGNSETATDGIPAALVNDDELIYQTAPDGTETPVFAGRQLVTELIADDSFQWTISNAEDAEQALADGDVHAVLTIPEDFSSSILSLSGDDPQQAMLGIQTDDAHSYLTGALSESVGSGMADAFGTEITAQYISGITSGMGELGIALGEAADGADQLADGVTDLGGGLSDLAAGADSASAGAAEFSGGVASYTGGVDQLASGLGQLSTGAAGLDQLSAGVGSYTAGVSQLAAEIAAVNADLAANPTDPVALATLDYLSTELTKAAAGGGTLAGQVTGGIDGVQSGIGESASGAAQLSAGSAGLRSGAASLATGVRELASGADSAAAGADQLSTGAAELASGLQSGAEQVPSLGDDEREASAQLAADPVGVDVTRANEVTEPTQALAAFLVPLGLWIGALAIFLVERRLSTRMLASTARSGRLLWSTLSRAGLIALGQAAVLVALLHFGLSVSWALLPATLAFAALMAVAFTAFHQLLVSLFGRAGLVVSLFAIAVQVTATGGLYPIELLSVPFQWVSPLLPLTYAVDGMQALIAGGGAAPVLGAAVALLAFGAVSALLSMVVIRRSRRAAGMLSAVRVATA